MLKIRDLRFRYALQTRYVLNHFSVACDSNGITSIVGRSGVGKSTLMAILSGILVGHDPLVGELEGSLTIDERSPTSLRGPSVISWVPQEAVLLDHLSVVENVILPLTIGSGKGLDRTAGMAILTALGIAGYAHSRPRTLSGGMKTRVSLARALVSNPQYLFLDEPFTGLDLYNRWSIFRILAEIRKAAGLATFLTSHDIAESIVLSDRILVMHDGEAGKGPDVIDCKDWSIPIADPMESLRIARVLAAPIESALFGERGPA